MKSSKTCTVCGETKSRNEFHPKSDTKDGLRYDCKECTRAAGRGRVRGGRYANPAAHPEVIVTSRPGGIVYKGVMLVWSPEGWEMMPVKHCKVCGIDQHLDVCLDCSDPIGTSKRGTNNIRPLRQCSDCHGWFNPRNRSRGASKCISCSGLLAEPRSARVLQGVTLPEGR